MTAVFFLFVCSPYFSVRNLKMCLFLVDVASYLVCVKISVYQVLLLHTGYQATSEVKELLC